MNVLKLAFDYRKLEGRKLKTFSKQNLDLSRQQLGLAIGGRKKLKENELIIISKSLNLPLSFFDIKIEIPEDLENIRNRITEKNILNEKQDIDYIISSILICYNTLIKFITNKYTIPEFKKEIINIVPDNFVIKDNKISFCEENCLLMEEFVNNFISFFDAKNKYFENIFGAIEPKGILIFSFANDTFYTYLKSTFLLSDINPIIFIERSLSDTEKRIHILSELSEILCCKKYNKNILLHQGLKQLFAFKTLFQDGVVNNFFTNISPDIYNYEKICKAMNTFNVSAKCVLSRLKELKKIDIQDYKLHEISKQIEKYYQLVYLNELNNKTVYINSRCNDCSKILNKIEMLLKENNKSWEFIANYLSITINDINKFCFDIDCKKESTIKNSLKFV